MTCSVCCVGAGSSAFEDHIGACRIVELGKGIYLPHKLVDELKAIAEGPAGRCSEDSIAAATSGCGPGSPRLAESLAALQDSDLWQLLLTTQEVR